MQPSAQHMVHIVSQYIEQVVVTKNIVYTAASINAGLKQLFREPNVSNKNPTITCPNSPSHPQIHTPVPTIVYVW